MNRPSPIDKHTRNKRLLLLLLACFCLLARAADGPLVLVLVLMCWCWLRAVCGDGRACFCCAPQSCSWVGAEVWEEMRRRGRSNGCEWAPWAGSGQREAGSSGGQQGR